MRGAARFSLVLASLLAAAAAPASPPSADDRIRAATEARNQGRTGEAIAAFEALAAERPGDAHILRLLATSYGAAKRYDLAAATLARARRLAPADRDIALAEARVALWSGRTGEAARIAEEIALAEPGNAELPALRASIRSAGALRSRVAIGASHGFSQVALAGPNRTWRETSLAIDTALGQSSRLSLEGERSDRALAVDTRLSVRADHRFGSGASLYLGASVTPDADFRERWSLKAGAETRLAPTLVATLDARHADYGATGVTGVDPGVRFEPAGGRYAVALRSINLWDEEGEHRGGWAGRLDFRPREAMAFFAGAATYPDTEAGITRRVEAFFAGAAVGIAPGLELRLTAEHERRVQSYRRRGATLGLCWRIGG
jgi:YaiO family outer membrane protein